MNGFWAYCQRKGLCPVCVQGKCLCREKAIDKTEADAYRSQGRPQGYNWKPGEDQARVNAPGHPRHGQIGTVHLTAIGPTNSMVYLRFPGSTSTSAFFHNELVPANETSNTISPSHPTGHEHEGYFAQKPAGKK